jgi:hypothetical protein
MTEGAKLLQAGFVAHCRKTAVIEMLEALH